MLEEDESGSSGWRGGGRKRERVEVNLGLKLAEKSKGIGNKS